MNIYTAFALVIRLVAEVGTAQQHCVQTLTHACAPTSHRGHRQSTSWHRQKHPHMFQYHGPTCSHPCPHPPFCASLTASARKHSDMRPGPHVSGMMLRCTGHHNISYFHTFMWQCHWSQPSYTKPSECRQQKSTSMSSMWVARQRLWRLIQHTQCMLLGKQLHARNKLRDTVSYHMPRDDIKI